MIFDIIDIEEKIGYSFRDKQLLKKVFTHSSYSHENNVADNEKLEFLGDAVLEFIVTKHIFEKFPNLDEGEMTVMRANAVSTKPLYDIVMKLGIQEHLLLGVGEKRNGNSEKCYADLFEAILAGIFLDGGIDKAFKFVEKFVLKKITIQKTKVKQVKDVKKIVKDAKILDYKSKLQEYVQKNKLGDITYELIEKGGADHEPVFKFKVLINNIEKGKGAGKNKKEATQNCAKQALEKLCKK